LLIPPLDAVNRERYDAKPFCRIGAIRGFEKYGLTGNTTLFFLVRNTDNISAGRALPKREEMS